MSNEWRRSIAALADPVRRQVYAQLVLDARTSESSEIRLKKRERALSALSNARLIEPRPDGTFAVNETAFDDLLAQGAPPIKRGVERFLRRGRIDQYPAHLSERRELLEWVVTRALPEREVLSEPEINERLAPFTDDVATLRRYMVDAGLVFREPDGRSYERRPSA